MVVQVSAAGSSSVNTAGRDALVTSMMICCGFVACWTLNEIFFFLNITGLYTFDFSGWFYHFTVVLGWFYHFTVVLASSTMHFTVVLGWFYHFTVVLGWFYHFTVVLVLPLQHILVLPFHRGAGLVLPLHRGTGSTTSTWYWFYYFTVVLVLPLHSGTGWIYHFTVALVFFSSCINPFIYAAKYREFQKGVRRLLPKKVHAWESQVAGSGNAGQGQGQGVQLESRPTQPWPMVYQSDRANPVSYMKGRGSHWEPMYTMFLKAHSKAYK